MRTAPLSLRFQKKIAGSGTVGDIGTHVVDRAHYLVGPIAEVIARTRTYGTTRSNQQGGTDKLGASEKSAGAERAAVDLDDAVVSQLRFQGGAIGSLEATRNAWGRNSFITLEIQASRVRLLSMMDGATRFQEMSLIPTLTVAQNAFLTREARDARGMIDDCNSFQRTQTTLTCWKSSSTRRR